MAPPSPEASECPTTTYDECRPWSVRRCLTAGERHRFAAFVRHAAVEFKSDRGSMVAAGMAFYWFLAVFPALLALTGVLGLVGLDGRFASKIPQAIEAAMPGSASKALNTTLADVAGKPGPSVIAVLIGISLSLWAGSAGMVALQRGLDTAYDVDEDRKFLKARLTGLGLLVATGLLGGLATAAIVFGKPIGGGIRDLLPLGAAFDPIWTLTRWTIGLGALAALLTLYYRLGPNRKSPLRLACSPGSLVATAGWLVASVGFSFYVSSTGPYAQTYGSLTGVVVLLMWFYISALALIFGAEINNEWEQDAAGPSGSRARFTSPISTGRSGSPPT